MKRRLFAAAAVLPLALALTACGGDDEEPTSGPTSAPTSAATTGSDDASEDVTGTPAPTTETTAPAPTTSAPSGGDAAGYGAAVATFMGKAFGADTTQELSDIGTCFGPKLVDQLGEERMAAAGTVEDFASGRPSQVNISALALTGDEADTAYDSLTECGLTPKMLKDALLETAGDDGTPKQIQCFEKYWDDDLAKPMVQGLFLEVSEAAADPAMTTFQENVQTCAA